VKRVLPAPLLSLILLCVWLMLARSLETGTVLLGIVLALAIPVLTAPLRPLPVRVRRPGVIAKLVLAVAHDVVVSNVHVAWMVLRARHSPPRSAFVRIPIELRDANGLATLALITTVVPGTVWCELALDRSVLMLHVFDVDDEAVFIDHYKARYEQPLMEIFE
jgi:multicomponent K+:H+ antiporter subunit E